jgi:hypothetical protein
MNQHNGMEYIKKSCCLNESKENCSFAVFLEDHEEMKVFAFSVLAIDVK